MLWFSIIVLQDHLLKRLLSLLNSFGSFVNNKLTIYVWVYYWAFHFMLLVFVYVFMAMPLSFDYYNSVVTFESRVQIQVLFFFHLGYSGIL